MTNPIHKKTVALIAGPTASGKTRLAIALATYNIDKQKYVIINADSAQIYKPLPILSAQPNPEELSQAEHRLFGYLDGSISCSAVSWANDAKLEINKAHNAGMIPILVGGTGLYLKTLLEGIAPIPDIDAQIRIAIRDMSNEEAYALLLKHDPKVASALHPNDTTRIARALEVKQSTGISIKEWREHKTGGIAKDISLKPLLLLPPREWLYERCDRRFIEMMNIGAIEEVEALLKLNPTPESPLWRAIGVAEIKAFLLGRNSRKDAIALGQTATRQYAKRQYTWFHNQPPSHWPQIKENFDDKNIYKIVTLLQ